MSFYLLLKSLDEFLYEVMSWLIFYPLTFWRAVRHPRQMMAYADSELEDDRARRYLSALSPPLFLLLTLLIAHGIELAVEGDSPIVSSNIGLNRLIDSDTNLIALRMVAFALFPLLIALRLLRCQKIPIDRESLRAPFFAQCYATAPMALFFSIGGTMLQMNSLAWREAGLAAMSATVIWFIVLQADWFRRLLAQSWLRAFGNALRAYVEASFIFFSVGAALVYG